MGESSIVQQTRLLNLIDKRDWNKLIEVVQSEPSLAALVLHTGASGNDNDRRLSAVGQLALHEVCKRQPSIDVIGVLIEANKSALKSKGPSGYTPLHIAVSHEASAAVVEQLISNYPPGTRLRDDIDLGLPLHLAAKCGASKDIVLEILIAHPEGIFIRDGDGRTAEDYVERIRSPSDRSALMSVLSDGLLLCKVSKAAQARVSHENETRLKSLYEAHSTEVTQWEERCIQDKLRAKKKELSLRMELKGTTKKVDSANKQLEEKLTQLVSMTKIFGAQEASLEKERKDHKELEESLESAKAEKQTVVDAYTMKSKDLQEQVKEKYLEISQLHEQVKTLEVEKKSLGDGLDDRAAEVVDLNTQLDKIMVILDKERKLYNDNLDKQNSKMFEVVGAETEKSRLLLLHVKEKETAISDLEEELENLEGAKASLMSQLNSEREVINMMVEEVERVPMLEDMIENRTEITAELEAKLEVCERAMQILSQDVEDQDKVLSKHEVELKELREERKSLRSYNSELLHKLENSDILVEIHRGRSESLDGLFKEMAGKIEGWSFEKAVAKHLRSGDSTKRMRGEDDALKSTENEKSQGQDGGVEVSLQHSLFRGKGSPSRAESNNASKGKKQILPVVTTKCEQHQQSESVGVTEVSQCEELDVSAAKETEEDTLAAEKALHQDDATRLLELEGVRNEEPREDIDDAVCLEGDYSAEIDAGTSIGLEKQDVSTDSGTMHADQHKSTLATASFEEKYATTIAMVKELGSSLPELPKVQSRNTCEGEQLTSAVDQNDVSLVGEEIAATEQKDLILQSGNNERNPQDDGKGDSSEEEDTTKGEAVPSEKSIKANESIAAFTTDDGSTVKDATIEPFRYGGSDFEWIMETISMEEVTTSSQPAQSLEERDVVAYLKKVQTASSTKKFGGRRKKIGSLRKKDALLDHSEGTVASVNSDSGPSMEEDIGLSLPNRKCVSFGQDEIRTFIDWPPQVEDGSLEDGDFHLSKDGKLERYTSGHAEKEDGVMSPPCKPSYPDECCIRCECGEATDDLDQTADTQLATIVSP